MPMLFARREPDHIAGMNLFNRAALALHTPETSCDNQGLIKTHNPLGRKSKCPGSGQFPADKVAARPPICAVCREVKRVRLTDGRIAAHKHEGKRCEGSGRAPLGGRDSIFMKGTGASGTFSGGLPGLRKTSESVRGVVFLTRACAYAGMNEDLDAARYLRNL